MGRVNGTECVGSVIDLYGSWWFLAILCRFLSFFFLADSAMCVALMIPEMIARIGVRSHFESSTMNPRGVSGGSWEHSVS